MFQNNIYIYTFFFPELILTYHFNLIGTDTFSGQATLQNLFPSEKWSTLKSKHLLPLIANYFLLQ